MPKVKDSEARPADIVKKLEDINSRWITIYDADRIADNDRYKQIEQDFIVERMNHSHLKVFLTEKLDKIYDAIKSEHITVDGFYKQIEQLFDKVILAIDKQRLCTKEQFERLDIESSKSHAGWLNKSLEIEERHNKELLSINDKFRVLNEHAKEDCLLVKELGIVFDAILFCGRIIVAMSIVIAILLITFFYQLFTFL